MNQRMRSGPVRWSCLLVLGLTMGGPEQAMGLETELAEFEVDAPRIDELFADLDSVRSPGCALGVMTHQQLVFHRGYGMASLEHRQPIDENTVFYTGSVSKQFTAAAVLMAAREGHLALDDDVRKWFSELPDYGETITVRHLVHHTSGLRDYLGLMSLAGVPFESVITPAWVIDLIARQKALNFAPGERYLYSNSGYFLLAQLVGRATGRSLRQYSEEKLFAPLDMRHSHFHDDRHEVIENRALGYSRGRDGFTVNWSPAFDQVGSGGLLSTIQDLLLWDRSYYHGRLGEGFWDNLETTGRLRDGESLSYAFGLTVDDYKGHRRVQHGGAMFGYRAQLSRFPEQQLTIAVLCNLASADAGGRASRVADLFLRSGDSPGSPSSDVASSADSGRTGPTVELTAAQRARWLGEYEILSGVALEIASDPEQEGGLVALTPDGQALALVAISESELLLPEGTGGPLTDRHLRLEIVADETALEIEIYGEKTEAPRLAALEQEASKLDLWVGSYWSEELGATAVLARDGAGLGYRIGATQPRQLTARRDHSVSLPGFRADGTIGLDGRIEAFVIDAGRVTGIRFVRTSVGGGK